MDEVKKQPRPDHHTRQLWDLWDQIEAMSAEINVCYEKAKASQLTESELAQLDEKYVRHYASQIQVLKRRLELADLKQRETLNMHETAMHNKSNHGLKAGVFIGAILGLMVGQWF